MNASALARSCPYPRLRRSEHRAPSLILTAVALLTAPAVVRGQIFVTSQVFGTVGEFTTSGKTINDTLISGLQKPNGIAVADGFVYVTNSVDGGTIGKYTTSGVPVDTSLVTGLSYPIGVAVSGDKLFVSNLGGGTVGEYTTDGVPINPALLTGLNGPTELALSGTDLYVERDFGSSIGRYTTAGATINDHLIRNAPGSGAEGFAVAEGKLFMVYSGLGTVAEYDAATGATLNPALLSRLTNPFAVAEFGGKLYVTGGSGGLGVYSVSGAPVAPNLLSFNSPSAVAVVPEPSRLAAAAMSLSALLVRRRRP